MVGKRASLRWTQCCQWWLGAPLRHTILLFKAAAGRVAVAGHPTALTVGEGAGVDAGVRGLEGCSVCSRASESRRQQHGHNNNNSSSSSTSTIVSIRPSGECLGTCRCNEHRSMMVTCERHIEYCQLARFDSDATRGTPRCRCHLAPRACSRGTALCLRGQLGVEPIKFLL